MFVVVVVVVVVVVWRAVIQGGYIMATQKCQRLQDVKVAPLLVLLSLLDALLASENIVRVSRPPYL